MCLVSADPLPDHLLHLSATGYLQKHDQIRLNMHNLLPVAIQNRNNQITKSTLEMTRVLLICNCFWHLLLHQLLPIGVNPSFVFARCLCELSPWFSLILVERCFTYWTNACELKTRLRTIQRKVEVAIGVTGLVHVYVFSPQSSVLLTSCTVAVICHLKNWTCAFNISHAKHHKWHAYFLSLSFPFSKTRMQECGQKMTEREVSMLYLSLLFSQFSHLLLPL